MIFIENRKFRLFRRKFLKKKFLRIFFSNGPNSKTTGSISKFFELETGENKNFRLSTFSTHSEEAQNFMFFVYGFSRPPLNESLESGTACRVAGRHIIGESVRGRGKTPETPPSIVEMILVTFGKIYFLRFLDSEIWSLLCL